MNGFTVPFQNTVPCGRHEIVLGVRYSGCNDPGHSSEMQPRRTKNVVIYRRGLRDTFKLRRFVAGVMLIIDIRLTRVSCNVMKQGKI
jgi:hypothetical protein